MPELDEILDDADFATLQVPICLKGSLRAQFEDADLAAAEAQAVFDDAVERNLPTAGPAVDRDAALEKVTALEERMKAASVTFTITGISTSEYNGIAIKHPPREDYPGDIGRGYNPTTFFPEIVRTCTIAPVMTNAQWDKVMNRLTDRQFDLLAGAVIKLNREDTGQIPFSYAASVATRSSGETSKSPSDSASASDASGDGNPRPVKKAPKTARGR